MPIQEEILHSATCDRCGCFFDDGVGECFVDIYQYFRDFDWIFYTRDDTEHVFCPTCASPDHIEIECGGGYYGDASEYAIAWEDYTYILNTVNKTRRRKPPIQIPQPLGFEWWKNTGERLGVWQCKVAHQTNRPSEFAKAEFKE